MAASGCTRTGRARRSRRSSPPTPSRSLTRSPSRRRSDCGRAGRVARFFWTGPHAPLAYFRSSISASRKATEDPILIDVVGKFTEIHVRKLQIVLNAPHLGWDDTESPTRLGVEVHNKNRMLGMDKRRPID